MELRTLIVTLAAAAQIAACGSAKAAIPDASEDIDCSVLAVFFNKEAERTQAPPDQRRAFRAVQDWYAQRVRAIATEKGVDKVTERAAPVLEAVKANPMDMRDPMVACTNRALTAGLR